MIPSSYMAWVGDAKETATDIKTWDETYEDIGSYVNPLITAYVALEKELFDIADDLGIGKEVRLLYHSVSMSARIGSYAGTAVEITATTATGGFVTATTGATGAALGMAAGMMGGLVLGIFALFGSSDQEEKDSAAWKRFKDASLAHYNLNDFAKEQRSHAKILRITAGLPGGNPAKNEGLAQVADKLADLYLKAQKVFTKRSAALLEATANIGRWQEYLAVWKAQAKYAAATGQTPPKQIVAGWNAMIAAIKKKIAGETAKISKLAEDAAKESTSFTNVNVIKSKSKYSAVTVGALILATWGLSRAVLSR